ncbi:hypothetical protein PENTCL1PPCAC_10057, partial [Pristionchus entomophagus]
SILDNFGLIRILRLGLFIAAIAIILSSLMIDLFDRSLFWAMSKRRQNVYMKLSLAFSCVLFLFVLSVISLIVFQSVDKCGMSSDSVSLVLALRLFLTIVITMSVVRFHRTRFFNVEQSVKQTLVELDQLLRRAKATQRTVEVRLVAGISRIQLRRVEQAVKSLQERIKNVKSKYESSLYIKFVWEDFIIKGEEIVDVCER